MDADKLSALIHSDAIWLTPKQVADVLGNDPQNIRRQARKAPAKLGFPVIVIGARTQIPRIPFLKFLGVKV